MKHLKIASATLLSLGVSVFLSACDRPVAPVVVTPAAAPPTVVAVPGPAGEPGKTGEPGKMGDTGKTGEPGKTNTDTVVVVPARP